MWVWGALKWSRGFGIQMLSHMDGSASIRANMLSSSWRAKAFVRQEMSCRSRLDLFRKPLRPGTTARSTMPLRRDRTLHARRVARFGSAGSHDNSDSDNHQNTYQYPKRRNGQHVGANRKAGHDYDEADYVGAERGHCSFPFWVRTEKWQV